MNTAFDTVGYNRNIEISDTSREIWSRKQKFSPKQINSKTPSEKWRSFCFGHNMLTSLWSLKKKHAGKSGIICNLGPFKRYRINIDIRAFISNYTHIKQLGMNTHPRRKYNGRRSS